MPDPIRCPRCNAELPPGSPEGLCPNCLLQAGMESGSIDTERAGAASPSAGLAPTMPSPPSVGFTAPAIEQLAQLFPQLEILELLGQGGMGAVYKARQKSLDRLVALKVLPPEVSRDPAFADRFTREAKALARLSHPHIVLVHDFGQAGTGPVGGLYYFIMEYVDGVNLRQAMKAGRLTPSEALKIVPQVCDALQFAHDEGIVHRDIKPENILVDKRGRVKIADFGLAKLMGQSHIAHTLTATHQIMGTIRYMAPEQMEGSHEVDHRADIYSLGVVFYEMLTGELPLGRFKPPSKKVEIDVRLDEVVLRTLEKEPELRYQQASEVKFDVETISSSAALPPVRTRGAPVAESVKSPAAAGPMQQSQPPTATTSAPEPTTSDHDVLENARHAVQIPAIGLMVVGMLNLLILCAPPVLLLLWKLFAPMPEFGPTALLRARDLQIAPHVATPLPMATIDSLSFRGPLLFAQSEAPMSSEGPRWMWFGTLLALTLLPQIVFAPLVFLGGWKMRKLQAYGLAVTAGILAMLPCQPAFLLGLPFGIWALIVLSRADVKRAFALQSRGGIRVAAANSLVAQAIPGSASGVSSASTVGDAAVHAIPISEPAAAPPPSPEPDAEDIAAVKVRVRGPARALIVLAILNFAAMAAHLVLTILLIEEYRARDDEIAIAWTIFGFLSIVNCVVNGIILVGALALKNMQSPRLARAASILAMLPLHALFPVGIPIGIWALLAMYPARPGIGDLALSKARVKAPAIGLSVLALLNFAAMVAHLVLTILLIGEYRARDDEIAIAWTAFGGASIVNCIVSGIMILGAAAMRNLHSERLARAASVLAMLPVHPFFPIGIPIGIWALVVMRDPVVMSAWSSFPTQRLTGSPGSPQAAVMSGPAPASQPLEVRPPELVRRRSSLATIIAFAIMLPLAGIYAGYKLFWLPSKTLQGPLLVYEVQAREEGFLDTVALQQAVYLRVNPKVEQKGAVTKRGAVSVRQEGGGTYVYVRLYSDNAAQAKRIEERIAQQGSLEFRVLADAELDASVVKLADSADSNTDTIASDTGPANEPLGKAPVAQWVLITDTLLSQLRNEEPRLVVRRNAAGQDQVLVLLDNHDVHEGYLADARYNPAVGGGVELTFNEIGARKMAALTLPAATGQLHADSRKRRLGMIFDWVMFDAPTINAVVSRSALIKGIPRTQNAEDFVAVLNAGRLPADLKLVRRQRAGEPDAPLPGKEMQCNFGWHALRAAKGAQRWDNGLTT